METQTETEVRVLADVERAVCDGLAWLLERWREQTPTNRALHCLKDLQSVHTSIDIDLVWEQEDYSGAVHYDLLIRAGEQGTVSLSFCPDAAVPWPLRNAFRASDGWVVKVNGRTIDAPTAMTTLDVIWGRTDLVQGLVNLALVDEAVTRRALTVSAAETQQAIDSFRRKHRLFTKAATLQYLEAHGLTQLELEAHLKAEVLERKLCDDVTGGKIEQYFEDHREDFETAHVARFRVADEAEGQRIACELRDSGGFFELAQNRFLDGLQPGPTFAVLRRGALSAVQAGAVFGASPGEIVVAPSGEGFDLVWILRIDRARLDETTRAQVRQSAFNAWLADARQRAQVTWFWGDPQRLRNQNNGWAP